jgi:hypothetical protein
MLVGISEKLKEQGIRASEIESFREDVNRACKSELVRLLEEMVNVRYG